MKFFVILSAILKISLTQSEYDMTPNPSNCSTYKIFVNGKNEIWSCSTGLHFSPTQLVCLPPEDAKCTVQSRPESSGRDLKLPQYEVSTIKPKIETCKFKKDLFDDTNYLKSACVVDKLLSYEDARQKCSESGMNLFIIDDESVETQFFDAITFILKSYPQGSVWINGKLGTKWEIFNPDGSTRGELSDKIKWYSKYTAGNCLKFSGQFTGKYQAMAALCTQKFWYICEHFERTEEPAAVDTSVCAFKNDFYKNSKYLKSLCVIKSMDDHDEARQQCARHGMNLFIINSKDVEDAFHKPDVEFVKKNPRGHIWINGMKSSGSDWNVYYANRSIIGPLYDEIEWVNTKKIKGRTYGDCLRYAGQYGPYQALGFSCNAKIWTACEYYIK